MVKKSYEQCMGRYGKIKKKSSMLLKVYREVMIIVL